MRVRCMAPALREEEKEGDEASSTAKQEKADRERIRRLIICLGDDKTKKVMSQIRGLAGALEDDVEPHGDLMQATLLECTQLLPMKSAFMAAWMARLAEKQRAWANAVVQQTMAELRSAILTGRVLVAQLLLRFLAGLGNSGFLPLSEVMTLFQELLSFSDVLRPMKGGDIGVFLMLATLPFLSPAAHAKVTEKTASLIAAASTYVEKREAKWNLLLRPVKAGGPQLDRLEAILAAVQALSKAGWSTSAIIVLPGPEPKVEAEGEQILPSLGITAQDSKKAKLAFQMPLLFTPLASKSKVEDSDEHMAIQDRWILEDYILMTIDSFAKDIEECTKQILAIPVQHPLFEAVVVDVIFSQMLRLPTPSQLPLFYMRLLEIICSKQSSMQGAVDEALCAVFKSIADMDEEAADVLADAFAYHITHMGWKVDWEPFLANNISPHMQRFIKNTFERLQRLSYHQNLLQKLPDALHRYVPAEPSTTQLQAQQKLEFEKMIGFVRIKDPNDRLVLRYCQLLLRHEDQPEDEERQAQREEAKDSEEAKNKEETEEGNTNAEEEVEFGGEEDEPEEEAAAEPPAKRARLAEKAANVKQEGGDNDEEVGAPPEEAWSLQAVAELVTAAVMKQGEKTPTHMSKVLDGNQQVLIELQPKDEEKAHALAKAMATSVFEFFQHSGHRLEITLSTLYYRGVLTPRAIAQQALAQRGLHESGWISVWRIIDNMGRKVLDKMLHSRQSLAEAKCASKSGEAVDVEVSKRELDRAVQASSQFFTVIFTGLVRNYNSFRETEPLLAQTMLQRILAIGRRYFDFIYPLIGSADLEERVPDMKGRPEVADIFQTLRSLAG